MCRPKKYKSDKELKEKIESYFVKENYPWTVSGMCIHLDIVRETLCDYEKQQEFSDTIKNAKLKIENYAENLLFSSITFTPGIVFNLKNNFGWKDKQEIVSENHNINEDITKLSKDDLQKQIEEYLAKKNNNTDKAE